ncbi:Endonuclease/exonuclease/phosphatase, partial [Mycena alexandri]
NNTRAHVRFAALNANGRNGTNFYHKENRWNEINRMVYNEKVGILGLGETHLSGEQVDEIESIYPRLHILNSYDPDAPGKGGVAIVLNRDLTNIKGVIVHRLIPGRAILATIPWHKDRTLTILSVYAPTGSAAENRDFWWEMGDLWLEEDLPVPDGVGGDMNVVEDPIDRLPHHPDHAGAVEALTRFKKILELKDGWRMTNPDVKAYTYVHLATGSHSRLDQIYVSPTQFKTCRNWVIKDVAVGSDHRMVAVDIHAPGSPFIGKGHFAIPLFLLKDTDFIEQAINKGCSILPDDMPEVSAQAETVSIQRRFQLWKENLQLYAQKRAKESVGALEQKKNKLQKERDGILNEENTPDLPSEPQERRCADI